MNSLEARDFILEEFKNVKVRIETHERHHYQMLVLSVTAMAAILGLSDKLPGELVPYITASILFVTTAVASVQKTHQSFETAYLLERFDFTTLPSFERTYQAIFVDRASARPKWRQALLRPISAVHNPFVALVGISLAFSVFFGHGFVAKTLKGGQAPLAALYAGTLLILHLFCLRNIEREKRFNTNHYRDKCRTILARDKICLKDA